MNSDSKLRRRMIVGLIVIHTVVILGLLCIVISVGKCYEKILLTDDGYYKAAGYIVNGINPNTMYGLGYPMILTILHIFPEGWQPFIRVLISLIFTSITVVLLFRIFGNYFTDKEIFLGGLVFVLNPLYVHWMFKSRVEAPLVLLLGIIIMSYQGYLRENKPKYIVYLCIAMAYSIFTKPVFMLVPFFALLLAVLAKRPKLISLSLICAFISIVTFQFAKNVPHKRPSGRNYYRIYSIVSSSFYVNAIIRNCDFKTQPMFIEDEKGSLVRNPRLVPGDKWKEYYKSKYKNDNAILVSLRFAYEQPGLVIQQLLVNPFLVLSLSHTEYETLFHFIANLFFLALAIYGVAKVTSKSITLYVHLVIVFAVYLVLVLVHSRSPYFIPIIPYLFVFAGRPISTLVRKTKARIMGKT